VLRGNWLCGGPLAVQAAGNSSSGPGDAVSVAGTSVNKKSREGARPLRLHFVDARPLFSATLSTITKVSRLGSVPRFTPYNKSSDAFPVI